MKKMSVFIAIPLMLLFVFIGCFPGYGPMGGYGRMGGWGHMMDYGYGFGGMFMWILFLIIIGAAIYFGIYMIKSKKIGESSSEEPMSILKKRYAKGEISKEEFDRMKNDLL